MLPTRGALRSERTDLTQAQPRGRRAPQSPAPWYKHSTLASYVDMSEFSDQVEAAQSEHSMGSIGEDRPPPLGLLISEINIFRSVSGLGVQHAT